MDFIITWVDGNDPAWLKEFRQYKYATNESTHDARFREWDNLQYWFRGVEKFAPWVNKIHFVTWGHLPKWLNINHPKLNIVKHEDYIPQKYLPTFSSRPIELNFHRISELSEEYVYFNDDTFLIDTVKEEDFFKNGKPCDMAISIITRSNKGFYRTLHNNLFVLNRHHTKKRKRIREKPFNWFNLKYGPVCWRNLALATLTNFYTGFEYYHLHQSSLKSTLDLLWEREYETFDNTCHNKTRNYDDDINSYIQRYWELASNNFYPINMRKMGSVFRIHDKLSNAPIEFIKNQTQPIVCINDYASLSDENFIIAKGKIKGAFESILNKKSAFEI